MTRYPIGAAFLLGAALVAGCGQEKELPKVVQPPDGSAGQQQAVPAQSDPDAKAVIDRAVKALAGGDLGRAAAYRDKVKASRYGLKGTISIPGETGLQTLDATRAVAAVWPNRVYGKTETTPQGNRLAVEVWLHRPNFAVANNGQFSALTNIDLLERNFVYDAVGQTWMPLLLPATDPKAVVFDVQSVTRQARVFSVVKLALGDEYPLYQLTFDSKTDELVSAEYTASDNALTRRTLMAFSDHKPGPDGLTLPHALECRHNGVVVEKWAVEKWEFPASIPDDQFAPPAKK